MGILGSLPVPTTAALTPRLGLMEPVDSDFFKSVDYNSTFQILDALPGTLPVANLAALQALTWGVNQHGTRVLQLDNGAEWYWYNPSGAGVWKRTNAVGLITSATQSATVSTTLQGFNGPTFITTPTFTAPGVRALRVDLRVGLDNSSGLNGIGIVTIYDNGTSLLDWNIRAGQYINANGVGHLTSVFITNPTAGSSHQISARVRSAQGSVANGDGGTTSVRYSVVTVCEV